jgi:hypothetical protein
MFHLCHITFFPSFSSCITSSVAFSPRANYTDTSTATCRRNLVSTFVDRGVSRGQRGGYPTVVNLSFLDRFLYNMIHNSGTKSHSFAARLKTENGGTIIETHLYNYDGVGSEPTLQCSNSKDSERIGWHGHSIRLTRATPSLLLE